MDLLRTTSKRLGIIFAIFAVLLLIVGLPDFGRTIILRQYDAVRLASFARQIDEADRAVATAANGSVTLTFGGAELEKILRAVSSGRSARMPDAVFMASAVATVSFRRGTNILGRINMSDQLFTLPGGPRFFDSSELLNQTVYAPLRQKVNETYSTGAKWKYFRPHGKATLEDDLQLGELIFDLDQNRPRYLGTVDGAEKPVLM